MGYQALLSIAIHQAVFLHVILLTNNIAMDGNVKNKE
jgi:hypothetical protein